MKIVLLESLGVPEEVLNACAKPLTDAGHTFVAYPRDTDPQVQIARAGDADVIMMIYREEVYDKNTTRKGIADIIITKQRNGEIGEVQLTFMGKYTKFGNYAPESAYGDGSFG